MRIETEITNCGNHYEIYDTYITFPTEKELPDTLSVYLKQAENIILKYADGYQYGLCKKMMRNEDAISGVAYAVMYADYKWKDDKGMSRDSWRIRNGQFAIQKFLARSRTKNNTMLSTIEWYDDTDAVAEKPSFDYNYFIEIQDRANLTPIEAECLKLRFIEDRSFPKIAYQLTLTLPKTLTVYNNALKKVKKIYQCNLI